MDWYQYAKDDWEIYHNASRLQKYVQFGKITQEQYEMIVNGGEVNGIA